MRIMWMVLVLILGIGTGNASGEPAVSSVTGEENALPSFSVTIIDEFTAGDMQGVSYHKGAPVTLDQLRQVHVRYWNFDGQEQSGTLVVYEAVADEIMAIFKDLHEVAYPIALIQPIEAYGGSDDLSMADNNTSAFNHRVVQGTSKLSQHAFGLAVDINPVQNPYVTSDGIFPEQGGMYLDREDVRQGMIVRGDPCYLAFTERGWQWGGDYKSVKDYQHFQKKIE